MIPPPFHVTLHHLSPGAKAAGLGFPDEQVPLVTAEQLVELLDALQTVAAGLTIYEPSSPEIRIRTDRDTYIVRTRNRRLALVGQEGIPRGHEHTVAAIMAHVSGVIEPVSAPGRQSERGFSASPMLTRPPMATRPPMLTRPPMGTPGSSAPPASSYEWVKIALLLMLSVGCIGGGIWMLAKPTKPMGPKFSLLSASESGAVLTKAAGEYRTGSGEGDRRLLLSADGTVRLAKFGPSQAIAEEIIRTVKAATSNGQTVLATTDPYLMAVTGPDSIHLFGLTFKRVVR